MIMAILERLAFHDLKSKWTPLPWQTAGLQYTRSGYGRKIPTPDMVLIGNKWRRVYCCVYSNIGTRYVLKGKDWIVIY